MVDPAARNPPDVSHLHPSARAAALLPHGERLDRIRSDRWIGYPRALEAVGRLEELVSFPQRQRMPNMLLIGPTNNGKSMIIERFRRKHRPVGRPDGEYMPVICVQMPAEPSPLRLYTAILAALGAPIRPRPRIAETEQLVVQFMRQVGARMLVLDELHNILSGTTAARREFLNLLRYIGNELRIPLVGVGTQEAYLAIRADAQLENRFAPLTVPMWRPGEQAYTLLASFAAALPLRRPSRLDEPDMAAYLLARSEGTIGELAALLTSAATSAVTSGEEAINARTLSMSPYRGPTQRRRMFERQLL